MEIKRLLRILDYYRKSKTIYSAHSPFVYDFFVEVLDTSKKYYPFVWIEKCRKELETSLEEIAFIEYGAGSKRHTGSTRRVSEIAKTSLSKSWQCQVLFNIVNRFEPRTCLELGTSLGISTAYIAAAKRAMKMISLEGNPDSAKIARNVLNRLGIENVDIRVGEFGKTLNGALKDIDKVDIAFIDGNHRKKAVLSYFDQILPYCTEQSILIIDDIYWSLGMNEAWQKICSHSRVTFTIDVFHMGMVFFNNNVKEKQHFQLIDAKRKPWAIGVFG